MGNETPSRGVDVIAVKGIAAKVQEMFVAPATFLSFPLAPIAYLAQDLRFLAPGGLTAEQAQTLAEFSELVNRLPLVSQVWTDDGGGRKLWDVYADLLAAELATSVRTPTEEQVYQRAYAYLHTTMPEPPDRPSQVVLDYKTSQLGYLTAEAAWRNGKDGPDAETLGEAKDQAWQDWKDLGHKDDVEEARLTLSTLSDKDPSIAWSRYRAQFDPQMPASFQTGPNGVTYVTTGFAPSGALDVPWERMNMGRTELDAAAAIASPELAEALRDSPTTGTIKAVSFDFMAVDVTRPWFDSSMLTSRAWRFRSGAQPLSDGGNPPSGRCPAYVSKLVLARNITVTRTCAAPGAANSTANLAFIEPMQANVISERARFALEATRIPTVPQTEPAAAPEPAEQTPVIDLRMARIDSGDLAHRLRTIEVQPEARIRVADQVRLDPALRVTRHLGDTAVDVGQLVIMQPSARAIENIQRFDFPVSRFVTPEAPIAAKPATAGDEVVTTSAEEIFIIAFVCRLVGVAPNPDPGLPWPT